MPEHTSFLTLLLAHAKETLSHNAAMLGNGFVQNQPPTWQSFEPIISALLVALGLVFMGLKVRSQLKKDDGVIPSDKLTLVTFSELFLGYFYNMAKDVMGPERAKRYFPVVGTSAIFVFCSNVLALVPGAPVPTSSLGITLGSALVVFLLFNLYGLKVNGFAYIKHFAGPSLALAPLMFIIEIISVGVRPLTLAIRLMLNMSVDHVIVGVFAGLVAVLVPVPFMLLGCIVLVVQTLVFTQLTCVYIGLATEPMHH